MFLLRSCNSVSYFAFMYLRGDMKSLLLFDGSFSFSDCFCMSSLTLAPLAFSINFSGYAVCSFFFFFAVYDLLFFSAKQCMEVFGVGLLICEF